MRSIWGLSFPLVRSSDLFPFVPDVEVSQESRQVGGRRCGRWDINTRDRVLGISGPQYLLYIFRDLDGVPEAL